MNSNELREHIRRLNEQEAVETEQRRQRALKKIQEIRDRNKYKEQEEKQHA
jgi:hypothetical protein